jgi:hypothetical protein
VSAFRDEGGAMDERGSPEREAQVSEESPEERLVKNEALFRDVNERMRTIDRGRGVPPNADDRWAFICECVNVNCADRIELTLEEYEHARARPHRFLVVPGHERPDVERVIRRNERFAVVEKHPGGWEIAEATDPRQ